MDTQKLPNILLVGDDMFTSNEREIRALQQENGHEVNSTFDTCTKLGVMRLNTTDYNFPKEMREASLISIIIVLVYYPVTMIIFYSLRKRFSIIRNRSFLLLCIQSLAQILLIVGSYIPAYIGIEKVSCDLIYWCHTFIIPLAAGPNLIRLLLFANQITLSRVKAAYRIEEEIEKLSNPQANDGMSSHSEWTRWDIVKSWAKASLKFYQAASPSPSSNNIVPHSNAPKSTNRDIKAAQFVTSAPYVFIVLFLVILPFFIAGIGVYYSIPYYRMGCTGCFLPVKSGILFFVVTSVLFAVGLVVAYKLRNENDPLYFLHEFVFNWIAAATGGLLTVGAFVFFPELMFLKLSVHFEDFVLIGFFFQHFSSCGFIIYLAWKSQKTKIREIRRDSILPEAHLKTILGNPDLRDLFVQFLESEFNADQFKFLIVVDLWRSNYAEGDSKVQIQARMIHENFTSKYALFPINIPSSIRDKICEEFERDPKQHRIARAVFDDAQYEISKLLAIDSLPRFLKSKLYTDQVNNNNESSHSSNNRDSRHVGRPLSISVSFKGMESEKA